MARAYENPLKKRFDRNFFGEIPQLPGVYFMRDAGGNILYVGKATKLRNRIRSYTSAKPGKVGKNIIKLLERVERISWEVLESEQQAWDRELLLIRALVPPYNIENAWREKYFFVALGPPSDRKIEFQLTTKDEKAEADFDLHGCYPMRRQVKYGYAALLRLLFAVASDGGRFGFPAKLARPSPCYRYSLSISKARQWQKLLSAFLDGESSEFMSKLVYGLLDNLKIPEYVRPGLQRDLNSLKSFEEACVLAGNLRKLKPLDKNFVTHRQLRRRIRDSVSLDELL